MALKAQGRFLLDFFHASEYLGAASQTCDPKRPARWRRLQQRRLRRGAASIVLNELSSQLDPPAVPDELAPVRAAHRYLDRRQDQLDYPRALSLDLPIGSGLIESGHRHVLQARLKQPGAAWLAHSAEAIAQLRVLRANNLWLLLWN